MCFGQRADPKLAWLLRFSKQKFPEPWGYSLIFDVSNAMQKKRLSILYRKVYRNEGKTEVRLKVKDVEGARVGG